MGQSRIIFIPTSGIGDRLLVAIGARIRSVIRLDDFVARLGGDEFVVLAYGTTQHC
ncbi:diguanylate cyclase domain-containing protein [Rhodanobacter sp. BL-MT-08]